MDHERKLQGLLEELATMPEEEMRRETIGLLEELQAALAEHRKIIEKQAGYINRLRTALKDVRDDRSP